MHLSGCFEALDLPKITAVVLSAPPHVGLLEDRDGPGPQPATRRPSRSRSRRSARTRSRRTVDVVGTLAAVDQVTISSEADGKVQPHPRGSRRSRQRRPGAHPARQREAAVQLRPAAGRARARAGAVRRDRSAAPARASRRRPTCRRRTPISCRRSRPSTARNELFKRTLISAAGARRCGDRAAVQAGQLRFGAAERRRTCAPASRHRRPAMKLADASCATPTSARRSTATSRSGSSTSASWSRRRCR